MPTEQNKALVRRVFAALNQGNLAVIDEMTTPTYVHHDPANPQVRSREDYRQWFAGLRTAFPDLQFTIEDLIAEGEKMVCRYTFRGTHTGQWRGMPATGKQVVVTGITISHMVEGKAVEDWHNADALGLLQQLGVIPAPGQAD
jgi:steroid delta-isomerase-like uncharacterized protein